MHYVHWQERLPWKVPRIACTSRLCSLGSQKRRPCLLEYLATLQADFKEVPHRPADTASGSDSESAK